MDEDSASIQLEDRRLGKAVDLDLPPGPPGVDEKSGNENCELRSGGSGKRGKSSSRRRSTSRGRSDSRNTSPSNTRRRHSMSRSLTPPRRGRYDSPDYGRYPRRRFDRRRSPERRRSPPRRGRRYGRSRTRSISPRRGGRWSPKKKPSSPTVPPQGGPPPQMTPGYGTMAHMYGSYVAPPNIYGHQYGLPPGSFPPPEPGYGIPGPPPDQSAFGSGYGPPPTSSWGVNEYGQQVWINPPMGGVQASATDALIQPQKARETLSDKKIGEEQKVPALEGAGLTPQDEITKKLG